VDTTSKVIATAFSLTGFTVAVVAGLSAGNPASGVLLRAILCMLFCHVVGTVVGSIAAKAVTAHLDGYRAANPIPELSTGSQPSAAGGVTPVERTL